MCISHNNNNNNNNNNNINNNDDDDDDDNNNNGSYCAESRNVEIPVDQIKPNTTKTFVVSVEDQSLTVFRTSKSNHAAVDNNEKRGE